MSAPTVNAVTICNSALLKIGADPISSLTQPGRAALVCNTLYPYIRDEVMRATPWRFATTQAVLSLNAYSPPFDYLYAYNKPTDCLRLLWPDKPDLKWTEQNGLVLTDSNEMNMTYIFRNTDESSWDNCFTEAFAWRMGMELALALTKSVAMKQEAEKSYKESLAQARAMNAVVGTLRPLLADVWSGARRGYLEYLRPSVGQGSDDPSYD